MATSSHAVRLRTGSRGMAVTSTTLPRSRGANASQAIAPAAAATPKTPSAPRQPNQMSAIGTAVIAARNAPSWMPVAYTPVPSSGRPARPPLTASGISALPSAMPMPTGTVTSNTRAALGVIARAMPATATSTSAAEMARVVPTRAASTAASGAKSPMQSTGIVTSRPAIACETPRLCWMFGSSGPIPTSCGRSESEPRPSATSNLPSTAPRVTARAVAGPSAARVA